MEFVIDEDVKAVAEFMQNQIAASRLVAVANAMAKLAPLFWGKYQPDELDIIRLVPPPISGCDQRTQSSASV